MGEAKEMRKFRLQVMDSSGDRDPPVEWELNDLAALEHAERVFNDIKKKGQVFYAQPNGEGGGVVGKFDPEADMIGTPTIVGG